MEGGRGRKREEEFPLFAVQRYRNNLIQLYASSVSDQSGRNLFCSEQKTAKEHRDSCG